MNKTAKSLLLALCAVLLVVGTVFGTLAYLQDSQSVTNTFTYGHVYIDLTETVMEADGKTPTDERASAGNSYELVPGRELPKDPTVTLKADSEESYVYMMVTVETITELMAALPEADYPEYYAEDGVFLLQALCNWDANGKWDYVGYETGSYLFVYDETVSTKDDKALDLEPLFSTITVPAEDVTNKNIEALAEVEIIVDAYAIQAEGFSTAAQAWTTGFGSVFTWPV